MTDDSWKICNEVNLCACCDFRSYALSLVPSPELTTPNQMLGQLEPLHMNCLVWKTPSTAVVLIPSHP
jgi:hypothetical protein